MPRRMSKTEEERERLRDLMAEANGGREHKFWFDVLLECYAARKSAPGDNVANVETLANELCGRYRKTINEYGADGKRSGGDNEGPFYADLLRVLAVVELRGYGDGYAAASAEFAESAQRMAEAQAEEPRQSVNGREPASKRARSSARSKAV